MGLRQRQLTPACHAHVTRRTRSLCGGHARRPGSGPAWQAMHDTAIQAMDGLCAARPAVPCMRVGLTASCRSSGGNRLDARMLGGMLRDGAWGVPARHACRRGCSR